MFLPSRALFSFNKYVWENSISGLCFSLCSHVLFLFKLPSACFCSGITVQCLGHAAEHPWLTASFISRCRSVEQWVSRVTSLPARRFLMGVLQRDSWWIWIATSQIFLLMKSCQCSGQNSNSFHKALLQYLQSLHAFSWVHHISIYDPITSWM